MLRRFVLSAVLLIGSCRIVFPQGLSPTTPAQEYIYLNGQIVAIENAAGAVAPAPPFGNIDIPGPGNNDQPLSGNALLSGWALSNTSAVSQVSISVDGQAMGNATYGASRPDVCQVYPTAIGCPAANVGWTYTLNTAALTNGSHTLIVTVADSNSPALTNPLARSFTVLNQAPPPGAPQADDLTTAA